MHVTVAICTYNRAAILRRTLDHLVHAAVPAHCSWEVVVVDNGSTDRTAAVLDEFRSLLPLRCVHEPKDGVAQARNAAVNASQGDYILWTDDDVFVDAAWMLEYIAAFEKHPDAAFFGGPIELMLEPPEPPWLLAVLPHLATVYGLRTVDASAAEITAEKVPWGANFAIRTAVQRRHLFDPRLGHQHNRVMLGEETAMLLNVLADGETGWWVPGARVKHFIPCYRQSWTYLASYWHAQGVWYGQGVRGGAASSQDAATGSLLHAALLRKNALQLQLRYWLRRLRYSKVQLLQEFAATQRAWGAVAGSRLAAQGHRSRRAPAALSPRVEPRA